MGGVWREKIHCTIQSSGVNMHERTLRILLSTAWKSETAGGSKKWSTTKCAPERKKQDFYNYIVSYVIFGTSIVCDLGQDSYKWGSPKLMEDGIIFGFWVEIWSREMLHMTGTGWHIFTHLHFQLKWNMLGEKNLSIELSISCWISLSY